ncbi:MAG TPA: ribosome silencing factor [candidate division Zixibacteria bacterium]|nr:ribosome silencing factor [candidate division Zixibacteria bacterium]
MTSAGSWDKALLVVRAALSKKASDVTVLEVRELTSIADYFVICSGRSDRQVQSIAQGIEEEAHRARVGAPSVEGAGRGHWVLLDFSDVVVHVFYEPVRAFYDLDGLWSHAPRVALPEPYSTWAGRQRAAADHP